MSSISDGIAWFKESFGAAANARLGGTPYSLDFLSAVAVQETFEVWGGLFKTLPPAQVLQLCVGDTLDAPSRSAFPTSKAELLAAPNGNAIFEIARAALELMAAQVHSYQPAARNPDKFCHGFGMFQYDIQFSATNGDFFLEKKWYDFDVCVMTAIMELNEAKARAYGAGKDQLTDSEMVYVAIGYNHGSVNIHGSFKQGFFDASSGKFYGELIAEYLALAKNVPAS